MGEGHLGGIHVIAKMGPNFFIHLVLKNTSDFPSEKPLHCDQGVTEVPFNRRRNLSVQCRKNDSTDLRHVISGCHHHHSLPAKEILFLLIRSLIDKSALQDKYLL
jgi:hypothetical protein